MSRQPYPPEYREQILSLHRSGRSVASLARDFEPSAATIHNWIKKAEADQAPELSDDERAELKRLRLENKRLRTEREILEKAAAWFAQKTVPPSHSGS